MCFTGTVVIWDSEFLAVLQHVQLPWEQPLGSQFVGDTSPLAPGVSIVGTPRVRSPVCSCTVPHWKPMQTNAEYQVLSIELLTIIKRH